MNYFDKVGIMEIKIKEKLLLGNKIENFLNIFERLMKNFVHGKKFQNVALRKYQTTYLVSVIKINRFSDHFFLFVFKKCSREIHRSRAKTHVLDRQGLQISLSCTGRNMNLVFLP